MPWQGRSKQAPAAPFTLTPKKKFQVAIAGFGQVIIGLLILVAPFYFWTTPLIPKTLRLPIMSAAFVVTAAGALILNRLPRLKGKLWLVPYALTIWATITGMVLFWIGLNWLSVAASIPRSIPMETAWPWVLAILLLLGGLVYWLGLRERRKAAATMAEVGLQPSTKEKFQGTLQGIEVTFAFARDVASENEWGAPISDPALAIAFAEPNIDGIVPAHPWLEPLPPEIRKHMAISTNQRGVTQRFLAENQDWILEHHERLLATNVAQGRIRFLHDASISKSSELRQEAAFVTDFAKRIDSASRSARGDTADHSGG